MVAAVEVVAQRKPVRRAVRAYPASANRPAGSPVTARPAPMMSHADLLALQRTAGNHAVARHVVQRQGTPGGNGGGGPATAAPAGPVGARTRRPIADLEREFRGLITAARGRGYPVAADNLEHFLTGGGATRSVPQTWLRSFSVVTEAERKNQERFEDQLKTRAKALAGGGSTTLSDWWAAVVRAPMGTELYFASGVSQLNSTGTFALSRAGQVVTIIGTTVNLRWFDPYNWNPGSSAWIPGHGVVSDDVGLDLKDAGRGHDYLLENLYTQTLAATYTIRPWYLPNLSSFAWATL
ncbi:MAG TPA: hypothetical protein VE645_18140 [Pseudonocardiaceae bacterium]|nr:hypothetical protein [Pseudonocardiaceae bacterium]